MSLTTSKTIYNLSQLPFDIINRIVSYCDLKTMTAFCQAMTTRSDEGMRVNIHYINTALTTSEKEIHFFLQTVIAKLQEFRPDSDPQLAALERILASLNPLPTSQFPNLRSLKRDYLSRVKADIIDILAIQPDITPRNVAIFSAVKDSCNPPSIFKNIFEICSKIIDTLSLPESDQIQSIQTHCDQLIKMGDFHSSVRLCEVKVSSQTPLSWIAVALNQIEPKIDIREMCVLIRSLHKTEDRDQLTSLYSLALLLSGDRDNSIALNRLYKTSPSNFR